MSSMKSTWEGPALNLTSLARIKPEIQLEHHERLEDILSRSLGPWQEFRVPVKQARGWEGLTNQVFATYTLAILGHVRG